MQSKLRTRSITLCCRIVGSFVEADGTIAAAFFDLDKTIISRSSTLAFGRSFYRHGLITRADAVRSAMAQLVFRLSGADHQRMERIRAPGGRAVPGVARGPGERHRRRHLNDIILPLVYADARRLIAAHGRAGQDVIIVSTSGQEMVRPIGNLLGASEVIATRMEVADGRYTGEMEFWAYGEAKASRVRELASLRGYRLAGLLRVQRLHHRPADAGGRGPPAGGESGPRAQENRARAAMAGAGIQRAICSRRCRIRAPGRGDPRRRAKHACSGHVNREIDRDHESVTLRGSQGRGSVVERVHGQQVRTRQPGTHARPAAGGVPCRQARQAAPGGALRAGPLGRERCTLGSQDLTWQAAAPRTGRRSRLPPNCKVATSREESARNHRPATPEWMRCERRDGA